MGKDLQDGQKDDGGSVRSAKRVDPLPKFFSRVLRVSVVDLNCSRFDYWQVRPTRFFNTKFGGRWVRRCSQGRYVKQLKNFGRSRKQRILGICRVV